MAKLISVFSSEANLVSFGNYAMLFYYVNKKSVKLHYFVLFILNYIKLQLKERFMALLVVLIFLSN